MKRLLCNLLLTLLISGCSAQGQNEVDDAAVHNVPQAFAAAWATYDGHQLAKLMSEDVDFVNIGGDGCTGEPISCSITRGCFRTVSKSRRSLLLTPPFVSCGPIWRCFTGAGASRAIGMKIWLVVVAQNTDWLPGPNPELKGIKPPIVFLDVQNIP